MCHPCFRTRGREEDQEKGTETMTYEELQDLENLLSRYVLLMTDSKSEDNRNALKVLGYVIEDKRTQEAREKRATHETITRYRTGEEEIHGHTSYQEALAFAQSREAVNRVGTVQIEIFKLGAGAFRGWLETRGGIWDLS